MKQQLHSKNHFKMTYKNKWIRFIKSVIDLIGVMIQKVFKKHQIRLNKVKHEILLLDLFPGIILISRNYLTIGNRSWITLKKI